MVDRLTEQVKNVYADKASTFFEKVKAMNLTDKELSAIPSLFIPGWGEGYDSSCFRVAIAGKETLCWANEYGDTLKYDLEAYENGQYDVLASCRRFREQGPAEWYNVFWQYPATALAKLFNSTRDEVLQKDNPLLRSIAWFNGHTVETYDSQGIDKADLSPEKMAAIQTAADESGLSDFEIFANVFRPDVILYFYRNLNGAPNRHFPKDIEFVRHWGQNDLAGEYRLCGRTILLQFPHTTWLRIHHIPEAEVADIVHAALTARNVSTAICEQNAKCDYYRMSAVEWTKWVEFVRNEAQKYIDMDNMPLSHHLMATVARELAKCHATMNAQTLVLILNEVDKFRQDNWLYSPERRGPCASVSGAWRDYTNKGDDVEAGLIAEAFTKLDGTHAWK